MFKTSDHEENHSTDPSRPNKARFRRCSAHVLNLTDELSAAKERRLNQFAKAVFIWCGTTPNPTDSTVVSFDSGAAGALEPNACITHTLNFVIFFPAVLLVFTWGATRRALNWGKWLVKKNNRAHLALRIQNILVHGAWNTSISVKLSRAGKRALFCRILWAMLKKTLRKSTKRSNVVIQLNPANPGGGGGGTRDLKWQGCGKDFFGFEILDFGYENFGKYFFWVAWFK